MALNINWLFGYYEKFVKRKVPSIRIMGGGAQSDLWCSIIASTLDRRIEQVADPLNAQLRGSRCGPWCAWVRSPWTRQQRGYPSRGPSTRPGRP
ncbi:MAG: hypothetical protein H6528_12730 [Actinobacteria bacterium]|nr:hypothetical protein [Actinomycetota bacterium]